MVNNPPAVQEMKADPGSKIPGWAGKILWRRKWYPTPVFLPGEPHGQRSLAGCSPLGSQFQTTEATGHIIATVQNKK